MVRNRAVHNHYHNPFQARSCIHGQITLGGSPTPFLRGTDIRVMPKLKSGRKQALPVLYIEQRPAASDYSTLGLL